jgi:hypothetical protein
MEVYRDASGLVAGKVTQIYADNLYPFMTLMKEPEKE